MDDLEHLSVEGYDFCDRCGAWVLEGRKVCDDCTVAIAEAAAEVVTIDVGHGDTWVYEPRPYRKPQQGEGKGDRGMTRRARDRARTRAWIRLAQIYEPMFSALYHEEQLREGLDPVPTPPLREDPTDLLLRDLEDYAERLRATSWPSGPSIPTSAQRPPPSGELDGPDS